MHDGHFAPVGFQQPSPYLYTANQRPSAVPCRTRNCNSFHLFPHTNQFPRVFSERPEKEQQGTTLAQGRATASAELPNTTDRLNDGRSGHPGLRGRGGGGRDFTLLCRNWLLLPTHSAFCSLLALVALRTRSCYTSTCVWVEMSMADIYGL